MIKQNSGNPKSWQNKNKFNTFVHILFAIAVLATLSLGFKIYKSEKTLIPLSIIPLICGLIYEYKRISGSWGNVKSTFAISYLLSFFIFLPGKHEYNYNIDLNISLWPYAFCFLFIVVAISLYEKKIIPKLTEGITLIQSIALIYWVFEIGFMDPHKIGLDLIMFFGSFFSVYSIYHAFSYRPLTINSRFILSIWSAIIMTVFAIYNIWMIYENVQLEKVNHATTWLLDILQYFLLGISAIYIVQNISMLLGFLPEKGKFFNKEYLKDIKKLKYKHVDRYSATQLKKSYAYTAAIFAVTIFGMNYFTGFLPGNIVIWVVFVLFPILVAIYEVKYKRIGLSNT
jgi:hypothetical protein